jgi:hypothetical protein
MVRMRESADRSTAFSRIRPAGSRVTIGSRKEDTMAAFWEAVTMLFVVGVLATVAYGTYRMFGGGHLHSH